MAQKQALVMLPKIRYTGTGPGDLIFSNITRSKLNAYSGSIGGPLLGKELGNGGFNTFGECP